MKKKHLRLALVQDNPVVGAIDANTQSAFQHIEKNSDADLVVFSECFVTGYPLNDLVLRPGFLREVEHSIEKLRDFVISSQGPAILIGAPQAGANLPYNAAYLIEPSGSTRIIRKTELPNSDVFDERRTFARADLREAQAIPFKGFRLGIQICEDMWHGRVTRALADDLADVMLVLNGSPYHRAKDDERKQNAASRVRASGAPLVYVNQVGGQDELVFDGASFTMNTNGGVINARAFEADTLKINLHRDADGNTHIEGATGTEFRDYPSNDLETDYRACVLGLRDYIAKTETPRVFVGVSGGLDSALVLTMAVDAIGADRVTGIMMPSRHTGQESLDLAEDLMNRLGVDRMELPIEASFDTTRATLAASIGENANTGLMDENLQARLRGMFLMAMTNALGGIVLSTGNKSEMAVGYATLYGDMNGGFNPMKSVYKSHAFDMAQWRNVLADPSGFGWSSVTSPIPDRIISRPPSAELAEDQSDAASLGDYKALDCVLKALVEQRANVETAALLLTWEFEDADLPAMTNGLSAQDYALKIARLVRRAQYKRVQSPPGVKLHPTDFGLGWRYPIAGTYTL